MVFSKSICFLNPWNPVPLHSRRWLDFSKTFWTHHLSDSKTKTVIDLRDVMHLRIVCDNFCKSLVMMEVLVVGENSWECSDFFLTDSSSFSVITQTIVTCHSCGVLVWGASLQMLIFWGCNYLQLFGDFLGSLVEFSNEVPFQDSVMLVLDSFGFFHRLGIGGSSAALEPMDS